MASQELGRPVFSLRCTSNRPVARIRLLTLQTGAESMSIDEGHLRKTKWKVSTEMEPDTFPENRPWRTYVTIGTIFAMSRALIAFAAWGSNIVLAKGKAYRHPSDFFDLFYRWDSHWYMSIVKTGYHWTPGLHSNVSFFPLYPMLIKAAALASLDARIAGFLISNVCLLAAAIFLFQLVRLEYDRTVAMRAVSFFLICPVSFFFSMVYTESIFVLLAIAAFYYARRGRWTVVGILGVLLTAARVVGILMIVPLAVEYFAQCWLRIKAQAPAGGVPATSCNGLGLLIKQVRPDFLWLLLVPLGILSYMAYLYVQFHNPVAFLDTQHSWGRSLTTILETLKYNLGERPFYRQLFFASAAAGAVITVYMMLRRMRWSYVVLCIVFELIYLSTGIMEALPRYLSVLFPMYMAMALAARRPAVNLVFISASVCLLTLCTILLANGYWID